jgi:hypothetical protein
METRVVDAIEQRLIVALKVAGSEQLTPRDSGTPRRDPPTSTMLSSPPT